LEVFSGDETETIGSGTAMLVPSNTEVGIKNQGNKTVNVLLISSPPPVGSSEELKSLLKKKKG
jgi:mannose-6-phosphate isomerase-like protein (cupin superfamily)